MIKSKIINHLKKAVKDKIEIEVFPPENDNECRFKVGKNKAQKSVSNRRRNRRKIKSHFSFLISHFSR